MGGKFQRTRSSTTHGAVPIAGLVETVQLIIRLQFLALLSSRPTSAWPQPVEAAGVPAALHPREEDQRPSSETIALHAYNLWLGRGRPIGTDWDDWLEAERQLVASA